VEVTICEQNQISRAVDTTGTSYKTAIAFPVSVNFVIEGGTSQPAAVLDDTQGI
jgi:hypothetical protein